MRVEGSPVTTQASVVAVAIRRRREKDSRDFLTTKASTDTGRTIRSGHRASRSFLARLVYGERAKGQTQVKASTDTGRTARSGRRARPSCGCAAPGWVFIKGGRSRRGVQRKGIVLYNKTTYNTM